MDIEVNTLHWVSGLFEGEACFHKPLPSNPNLRHITITMTDEDVIRRVSQLFDLSYTYLQPVKAHWKPSYKFSLSGKRALELMKLIYPIMGRRRQQKIAYLLETYIAPSKYNSNSKLTEENVREIRQRIAAKDKAQLIANDFGVTIFTIREISQGKTWKHVDLTQTTQAKDVSPVIAYDFASVHWLAGLFEGEGSFCPPPPSSLNQPYANIVSTDEDVIARAAKIIGISYTLVLSKNVRHKNCFIVRPKGARAVKLMRQLYPLMGERRRQQIDHALENYVEITDGKGENHSQSKLTTAQVIEIKRRLVQGESLKLIASDYAVSYYTIQDIKRGKSWTHITLD